MTARMSLAEFKATAKKPKGRNKYGNVPTVVKGVRFASKAEAKRDAELQLLKRQGKIRDLERQPRFPLKVDGVKIGTYVADWQYIIVNPTIIYRVVEDKKGVQTRDFRLKWKLAQVLYPAISEWRLS
jgi:hypothetical protein